VWPALNAIYLLPKVAAACSKVKLKNSYFKIFVTHLKIPAALISNVKVSARPLFSQSIQGQSRFLPPDSKSQAPLRNGVGGCEFETRQVSVSY